MAAKGFRSADVNYRHRQNCKSFTQELDGPFMGGVRGNAEQYRRTQVWVGACPKKPGGVVCEQSVKNPYDKLTKLPFAKQKRAGA